MNNFSKVLVVMTMSLLGTTSALADWQADAAHLSSEAGIDTASGINSLISDIGKFQPPQPCIDTNPETFTMGTPATLSCGGGSGGAAPPPPAPGSSTVDQQETGSGQTFDHM